MLTEDDKKVHQMRARNLQGKSGVLQAAAVQYVQLLQAAGADKDDGGK